MGLPMLFDHGHGAGPNATADAEIGAMPRLSCPIEILGSIGPQREARMSLARLLLEVAQRIQRAEGDSSARLLFAVDICDLDRPTRSVVAVAATTLIAGAIRRLRGVNSPELLVVLKNHCGEIRVSAIDNSARPPGERECASIRQIIAPLGGLHDRERQGSLVESSFCFLLCSASARPTPNLPSSKGCFP